MYQSWNRRPIAGLLYGPWNGVDSEISYDTERGGLFRGYEGWIRGRLHIDQFSMDIIFPRSGGMCSTITAVSFFLFSFSA